MSVDIQRSDQFGGWKLLSFKGIKGSNCLGTGEEYNKKRNCRSLFCLWRNRSACPAHLFKNVSSSFWYITLSFLYHKPISLQLNTKDEFGRFLDPVEGQFLGEAYEDYFVLNEQLIYWTDVRHVSIKKEEKWFKVDYFKDGESSLNKQKKKESKIEKEIELIKNEYYQDFADDDWRSLSIVCLWNCLRMALWHTIFLNNQ